MTDSEVMAETYTIVQNSNINHHQDRFALPKLFFGGGSGL
jgi:hypothetical protein